MKKILIFYASYGGGHLNAAKSIKEYFDNNYKNCETELIDCMKYVNKPIEIVTTPIIKNAIIWYKTVKFNKESIIATNAPSENHINIKLLVIISITTKNIATRIQIITSIIASPPF